MDFDNFPYVIVGSGLLGSVLAERIATQLDLKVLVIEKRDHIGGNCYSEEDPETGIEYHRYGTHIFHTSEEKVWDYVCRFATFNSYRHQVLSCYKGRMFQFPINLGTINKFYNVDLRPCEVDSFMARVRSPIPQPANFEEQAIALLGAELYEAFFKHYTLKQWQLHPHDLPASVFNRLPIRKNYNDNYFFDRWQGIPEDGYTRLFERLLSHKNITLMINTDYFEVRDRLDKNRTLIYSGPIDRFFDYSLGRLTWRTLRFEKEVLPMEDYQGNSVINYPEPDFPYTRIHEPRHLHPERCYRMDSTVIFREYSLGDTGDAPFYPIPSTTNHRLLAQYQQLAQGLPRTFIGGRLGDYKYYDMDKTIQRALELFEQSILPAHEADRHG
jgi:UDP-galactopyranose mutase